MQCRCCHQMMNETVPSTSLPTSHWLVHGDYTLHCNNCACGGVCEAVLSRAVCVRNTVWISLSASLICHISISWWSVFTAAQWLRLWGHSKSSVGLNPGFMWGIYMFTMYLCGFSPGASFFPQSWDLHVMLHSNSKLALGVNMTTNDCTSLCTSP